MKIHYDFTSRRSSVIGRRGMVATSQPLAVAAGLEILAQGGNAADAAVAIAAALNVTEPTSTGIGGDAFALFYQAASGQVTALNASGRTEEQQLAKVLNGHELTIEGRAPQAGEIFRNPGLARTFHKVAEGGKDAFYQGEIAEVIVDVIAQAGNPENLRTEPLYLVWINGKRDQCCSIYGPETYRAMTEEAGEAIWQSFYIGGHNQAPISSFHRID